MTMGIKLFFILMFTVVLVEANLRFLSYFSILELKFSLKAIVDFLFPKDLNLRRVRYADEIQTKVNNVTTLDFVGLVKRHGYPAEEHYVTTEDGYNLIIHRIPGSPLSNSQQKRKIIFLQHGAMCTSDCWVIIGPGKDLAFLLADHGYDVWLGNVRGNSYCRSHVKLSSRNKDFWQFSFHEVGVRDLPVMIDYVLSYTKQKTLCYVGYSLGTTELFVLLSMKPEYNAKIKLGVLLGSSAIWKEMSPTVKYICSLTPMIKEFFDVNEIYELGFLSSNSIMMGRILCSDKAITQFVCVTLIFKICGSDPAQVNTTALPEMFSHFPAGTSVQTFYHMCQNIKSHKFQTYDYGYFGNYKQYGQTTPIIYDLKRVVAPLALFYGANDLLASKSNVFETYRHLSNVILLEENPYKLFTHFDFQWAINGKTLIYDRVIEVLQEYNMMNMTESMN